MVGAGLRDRDGAIREYQQWMGVKTHPADIVLELQQMAGMDAEIVDRFYRDLDFGTGGLRGVMGAGTNRMNVYTVRRASLGLARHVARQGVHAAERGIVIGYDCRHMSREFALESALVMTAAGVRAYVFEHLCPTPQVSFAIRTLGAAAGVMITASHNPPVYNGYKVYGGDGGQILPDEAARVMSEIEQIGDIFSIPVANESAAECQGRLVWLDSDLDEQYYDEVVQKVGVAALSPDHRAALRVVYTPLHGTGNHPVRQVLSRAGYSQVWVVAGQELPDGDFPTVSSPNPEEPAAFADAIALAEGHEADIVLATDPDADRVGVAVRDSGGHYTLLSGNQTGGLLLHFLLDMRHRAQSLPANAVVCKTIVTSELGAVIAEDFGISVENTLTGFKYIGECIGRYEKTRDREFIFGYEESYGYLIAPMVRDKDAVQTCLLIAEMAAFYRRSGKTLLDALEDLYQRYGYFREQLVSLTLPGLDGLARIESIMGRLRRYGIPESPMHIEVVEDYWTSERTSMVEEDGQVQTSKAALVLPQADVLKFVFEGGSWMAIRPSGTEPKIKVYLGARAASNDACHAILNDLAGIAQKLIRT